MRLSKGDVLYATTMGWPPDGKLTIETLANNSEYFQKEIQKVEWSPNGEGTGGCAAGENFERIDLCQP